MLLAKNLDTPDEKRSFEHGELQAVTLRGSRFLGGVPSGWRWSEDVKPLAGTESCQVTISQSSSRASFHVQMADGDERDLGPVTPTSLAQDTTPGSSVTSPASSSTSQARRIVGPASPAALAAFRFVSRATATSITSSPLSRSTPAALTTISSPVSTFWRS